MKVFVLAVFIGVVAAGGYEGQGYKEKNQYEAPSYSNPPGYPPYVNNYYNNPRYSGDYVNQGYQANQYGPGKNYYAGAPYAPKKYAGSYGSDSYGYKNDYTKPYEFSYAVNDDYTYTQFSQRERGDNYNNKEGVYSVDLPDGRTQTVTYTADSYGYNADVEYSGQPNYGQAYSTYNNGYAKKPLKTYNQDYTSSGTYGTPKKYGGDPAPY